MVDWRGGREAKAGSYDGRSNDSTTTARDMLA